MGFRWASFLRKVNCSLLPDAAKPRSPQRRMQHSRPVSDVAFVRESLRQIGAKGCLSVLLRALLTAVYVAAIASLPILALKCRPTQQAGSIDTPSRWLR